MKDMRVEFQEMVQNLPGWDDECQAEFDAAGERMRARQAARASWKKGDPPFPPAPPFDRHHDGSEMHRDGQLGYACYICRDSGFVRRDLPITDPDFGKHFACSCRGGDAASYAALLRQRRNTSFIPDAVADCTLDSFTRVRGATDALAHAQAWRHSWEQRDPRWLVLWGATGRGKTHLLGALANIVLLTSKLLWVDTPWVLSQMAADNWKASDQWLKEMVASPVLVLDEFGSQSTMTWVAEKLEVIVVERYANQRPTLFGMTCTPKELEAAAPRIASRLKDATFVTNAPITAGDYRSRPAPKVGA